MYLAEAQVKSLVLTLRMKDKAQKRPYKVPGGNVLAFILAIICEVIILAGIVFFIWVPGEPVDWAYAVPILIGIVVTIVLGEITLLLQSKKKQEA